MQIVKMGLTVDELKARDILEMNADWPFALKELTCPRCETVFSFTAEDEGKGVERNGWKSVIRCPNCCPKEARHGNILLELRNNNRWRGGLTWQAEWCTLLLYRVPGNDSWYVGEEIVCDRKGNRLNQ